MTGRARVILIGLALLLASGGLLAVAFSDSAAAPAARYEGPPFCDGEEMHPGDLCLRYPDESRTYEEEIAYGEAQAVPSAWQGVEFSGGLAALLLIAGAVTFARGTRLRGGAGAVTAGALVAVPLAVTAFVMAGRQDAAQAATSHPVSQFTWFGGHSTMVVTLIAAGIGAIVAAALASVDLDAPPAPPAAPAAPESPAAPAAKAPAVERTPSARALAQKAFEEGETADPWASWRVPAERMNALGVLAWIAGAVSLAGALAVSVLSMMDKVPADGLMAIAPGALSLAGLVAGSVQWRRTSGWHGIRYGLPALLAAAVAVLALVRPGPVGWPELIDMAAPAATALAFTRLAGAALPRPALSGRLVFTTLSLASVAVAVDLTVRETTVMPALAGVVFALLVNAWLTADTATKCERGLGRAPGSIGRAATVIVLAVGIALLLAAGANWLGWTSIVLFGLSGLVALIRVFAPPRRVRVPAEGAPA